MEHLKGKGDGLKAKGDAAPPKAYLFETGTNEWRRFEAWPAKNAVPREFHFDAAGKLSMKAATDVGFDEYLSDPDRPVPVIGDIGAGMPGDYMTYDQRFASKRPDVLVYQTEPLDHDVTIAGPITPVLSVSTTGTDSDFVVKLIDVYPTDYPDPDPNPTRIHMGGYQQLVRGEPFRGKFRDELRKTGAIHARKTRPHRIRNARRLPYLPHRASHHGAGPELLVPAYGPQSATVPGYPSGKSIRFPKSH